MNKEAISIILAQEDNLINLLKELKPTTNNKERTTLEKHLTDYTSRNSFDYFIHKDLKGFLSRELDFFIKNEIWFDMGNVYLIIHNNKYLSDKLQKSEFILTFYNGDKKINSCGF